MSMPRHRLGASRVAVTPLGLGLAALGRPGYITLGHADDLGADRSVATMAAHAHAVLDAAWAVGIRYFDTARSYGRGEEFLGAWLAARTFAPDDRPVVGSKWGYTYTAGWRVDAAQHEVKEHTLPVLRGQWVESAGHLGEYLALYQIHSATLESGVLTRAEVLGELARIKAGGCLIGLSLSGTQQAQTLAAALEIEVDGVGLFDCVQATWNVLEPSCGPMLRAAHAAGWGVIVKEALANGRLTARNRAVEFAGPMAVLARLAARHATTVDALALAAALAQPWAGVALSGAATPAHLRANVAALAVTLTEETWEELAGLAETPQAYWATRSALAWN